MGKTSKGLYRLGLRSGFMADRSLCEEKVGGSDDGPGVEVSFRSAASAQSTETGNGFRKCSCQNNFTLKILHLCKKAIVL